MKVEEKLENETKRRNTELLNEMCTWLNKAEIDFEKKSWETLEGLDLIIGDVTISFYETGRIEILPTEKLE